MARAECVLTRAVHGSISQERPIDLRQPLSLGRSFAFPLQNPTARREILWGALLLVVPGIGWLWNMGHRIRICHRLQMGEEPWPAWGGYGELLRHGAITAGGMVYYAMPGLALFLLARVTDAHWLVAPAALLAVAAVLAIPGYMTHYCVAFDPREIYDPLRALRRVREGGSAYWHAWAIAVTALAVSFLGLLAGGIGFLVTSVWFWQVAGFSFATVFSQRFHLVSPRPME